ncbi:hypothetical protein WS61_07715 [Burkholderia sp. ABCPW 11]|nr:hypothetical protein WS61_07715 [Burkholderia sp. ABCPW 11]KVS70363.1 hypothetical protein WK41_19050 [Burkholderia cepacia]
MRHLCRKLIIDVTENTNMTVTPLAHCLLHDVVADEIDLEFIIVRQRTLNDKAEDHRLAIVRIEQSIGIVAAPKALLFGSFVIVSKEPKRKSTDLQRNVHRGVGQFQPLIVARSCQTNKTLARTAEEQCTPAVVTIVFGVEKRLDAVEDFTQIRGNQVQAVFGQGGL